jgi:hypothetical protein
MEVINNKSLVDCDKSDVKKFYELNIKYKNATESKRGEALLELLVFTQKLGCSSLVDALMDKEFKNEPMKKFMIKMAVLQHAK